MKTISGIWISLLLSFPVCAAVLLDGKTLTPALIAGIADGEPVRIAPDSLAAMRRSHEILIKTAGTEQPVYGLTRGVGLNKDKKVTMPDTEFNLHLLRAHGGGTGKPLSVRQTRAVMATRLNMLLTGGSGAHPDLAGMYLRFLNQFITPLVPSAGSVGEADITQLSHIGLAMSGEGDVDYRGKQMKATEALKAAGIPLFRPSAKDALSVISSNAVSSAMAALALYDAARLTDLSFAVYALALEALNGNIHPFTAEVLQQRPYPAVTESGQILRLLLRGSSLSEPDPDRRLQDPLSFRSALFFLADLRDSYQRAYHRLLIQLNSTDDNPVVIPPGKNYPAGAVIPSANFEPLPWVTAFEQFSLSVARYSLLCAQQLIVLNTPAFTGLSRFLATEETVHAFGAIEKDMMALALHNKSLAMPLSMDYLPVAGGIEDIATRAPAVTQHLQQQIDNCYELLSILLIHSAQAVDLRRQQNPHFRLAQHTASLYDVVRASAAFMQSDKAIRPDVQTLAGILRDHHNDIIRSLYAIHQYPHHQRRCDRRTKAKTD